MELSKTRPLGNAMQYSKVTHTDYANMLAPIACPPELLAAHPPELADGHPADQVEPPTSERSWVSGVESMLA